MPSRTPPPADVDALVRRRAAVEVRWDDSWGNHHGSWEARPEVSREIEIPPIRSVGVLVRASARWLWLAQSLTPQEFGHALRIPRACVVSVRELVFAKTLAGASKQ